MVVEKKGVLEEGSETSTLSGKGDEVVGVNVKRAICLACCQYQLKQCQIVGLLVAYFGIFQFFLPFIHVAS